MVALILVRPLRGVMRDFVKTLVGATITLGGPAVPGRLKGSYLRMVAWFVSMLSQKRIGTFKPEASARKPGGFCYQVDAKQIY